MRSQSDLEAILDKTYAALLRGDMPLMAGLAEETGALADGLGRMDRGKAERLRRKAERNAALLQAAARGVRSATGRLAEIAAGPQLTTYTMRGRKESLGSMAPPPLHRF
ncbi:MAG: hypothetical protein HC844_04190 [Tabrizicola sp.]|nr:hypothetical protein [Tabrizicola sp.]